MKSVPLDPHSILRDDRNRFDARHSMTYPIIELRNNHSPIPSVIDRLTSLHLYL